MIVIWSMPGTGLPARDVETNQDVKWQTRTKIPIAMIRERRTPTIFDRANARKLLLGLLHMRERGSVNAVNLPNKEVWV